MFYSTFSKMAVVINMIVIHISSVAYHWKGNWTGYNIFHVFMSNLIMHTNELICISKNRKFAPKK